MSLVWGMWWFHGPMKQADGSAQGADRYMHLELKLFWGHHAKHCSCLPPNITQTALVNITAADI